MKIICTADVHLHPERPERLERFHYILETAVRTGVSHIIVAGDLFDRGTTGYHDFEALLNHQNYAGLTILAIPGNHDIKLKTGLIAAKNLTIFSEPAVRELGGQPFLFVPYIESSNLARAITGLDLPNHTVIVSHGDVAGSRRITTGNEDDAYFPMETADLDRFKATAAILGHIHVPHRLAGGRICYPGSPFPCDPSETGIRKYLVIDPATLSIDYHPIPFGPVYQPLSLSILPDGNEIRQIENGLADIISEFRRELAGCQFSGEIIFTNPKLTGYTLSPRAGVLAALPEKTAAAAQAAALAIRPVENPEGVHFSEATADPLKAEMLTVLRAQIQSLPEKISLPDMRPGPSREQVEAALLNLLYGGPQ